jgi:uncharacterized membrane protein
MNPRPMIAAGTMLGIGLGGFIDGILFHQLLQIHNMLSARLLPVTLVNAEINMFWDGVFHARTWLATAAGLWMLFRVGARRDVPWSGRVLLGGMVFGWGLFNFVEGVIDHHILQVHHVVERLGVVHFRLCLPGFGHTPHAVGLDRHSERQTRDNSRTAPIVVGDSTDRVIASSLPGASIAIRSDERSGRVVTERFVLYSRGLR